MSPRTDGLRPAAPVHGATPGRRVRTVFLGSGAFGVPTLRRLASRPDIKIVAVVTAPPRPVGRHQALRPTPIGELAMELGLEPLLTPRRLSDPGAIDAVLELDPALAVLADYGQIVPEPLLDLPLGALNLHPSDLPRWRGASPVPATIAAGDPSTAVTLMRMDSGLDTGPVVAREEVKLTGRERTPELEAQLAGLAADVLDHSLGPWLRGELPAVPQAGEATMTRLLRREDGRLDPGRPAAELERLVRAYQPWPGTFVELAGERVVVTEARVAPAVPGDRPGTLVLEGDEPALATAAGRLVLVTVIPAGRRAMAGAAYLRGRPGSAAASAAARG